MVLPFHPLSLVFDHVNYYLDMPAVSHFIPYTMLYKLGDYKTKCIDQVVFKKSLSFFNS